MRKCAGLFGIGILMALAASTSARADADGHVNFFLGQKSLDSDDWEPIDDHGEFGAIMSFGETSWPIHIAVDVMTSVAEEDISDATFGSATLTGVTFEVASGVRKIWNAGNMHPYVGGGFAVIGAAVEADDGFATIDADDSAIGPWASAGLFWRLGKRFNIGFDFRWSDAEVDLDFGQGIVAQDVAVGGLHAGMTLGFGW